MLLRSVFMCALLCCANTLGENLHATSATGRTLVESAMDTILRVNLASGNSVDNESIRVVDTDMIFRQTPDRVASSPQDVLHAAMRDSNRLWSGAVIPYVISYEIQKNKVTVGIITEAMREWETKTCIRFVTRTDQVDYVEFVRGHGCNSEVGRRGGRQTLSLGNGCMHFTVIVHELGHVIGFWHEQNRPDRDEHVTIEWDNIMKPYFYAFDQFNKWRINSLNVSYDYNSIMHYGSKAFSKNDKETIIPKKPGVTTLGNVELSELDIRQTNLLYNCDRLFARGWTSWSSWSSCNQTCGGGVTERKRICTRVSGGVSQCHGANTESKPCNQQQCPEWPKWPQDFIFRNQPLVSGFERCVMVYERSEMFDWRNSAFCSSSVHRDPGFRWSERGTLTNMQCTHVYEPSDPKHADWMDNYLCIPMDAPYTLQWSYNGKIPGQQCVQWLAKQGMHGWDNNYLCGSQLEMDALSMGSPEHLMVHGSWGSWSTWSVCSKSCDGGEMRRVRACTNPSPLNGGKFCHGPHFEAQGCNIRPCSKNPTDCGGQLVGDRGEFISPGYPSQYPNDARCVWNIQVSATERVILTFTSFLIEGPYPHRNKCVSDVVTVYDGAAENSTTLGQFCDNKLPNPIISSGNRLSVVLKTDSSISKAGFRAYWRTLEIQGELCGGELTQAPGTITSPNYPSLYPPTSLCEWTIRAPENQVVVFTFEDLKIEEHQTCRFDKVELHEELDGVLRHIGKFCGDSTPESITTTGPVLLVKFTSDISFHDRGFKAKFTFANKGVVTQESTRCPESWTTFTDPDGHTSCYLLKSNYYTWFLAKDDCLSNGGDLVSIGTQEEQEFVQKQLLRKSFIWIGLTDNVTEGQWSWSDQSPVSFINWDGGDPNDGGALSNEDCALMTPDGKWNDYPCTDRFRYICEVKPGDFTPKGRLVAALTRLPNRWKQRSSSKRV